MAITAAELQVIIGADFQEAEQGLKQIDSGVTSLGSDIGRILGIQALGVFQQVGGDVREMAGSIISAAAEAQSVQTQLNAVLKSTKGVAGVTAEQANALADSLSKLTPFEDEAILSAENLLLTFTNIGKDVFPSAIETVLDMSQALGQDLKSSAIQLGKALQDPVEGVSALRRVGVNFSKEQQEMIKDLVESGEVIEAQRYILKELATEFGGSAHAAGKTFAGQMAILQTQLGNVKEALGAAFLPLLQSLIPVVEKIVPILEKLVGWFTNLPEPVRAVIAAIGGLIAIGGPIIAVVGQVVMAFSAIGPILSAIGPAIAAFGGTLMTALTGPVGIALLVVAAVAAIAYAIYKHWDQVKAWLQNAWETIKTAAITAWESIKNWFQTVWEGIRSFATGIWGAIVAEFQARVQFLQNLFLAGLQFIQNLWQTVWGTIQSVVQSAWSRIVGLASQIVQGIRNAFSIDWGAIGSNIISGIVNGIRNGIGAIIDAARSVAQAALNAAKAALGISSPSKEFEKIAGNMLAGWERGLQTGSPTLEMQVGTLAKSLVPTSRFEGVPVSKEQVINVTINNPLPERSPESVRRTLQKLSYLGVV